MRLKAKVDSNQAELVELWRKMGLSYAHLHQLGKGVPDGLIGVPGLSVACYEPVDLNLFGFVLDKMGLAGQYVIHAGCNIIVEIKDGSKPPSRQRLTSDEADWHSKWRGQVAIVRNVEEAREVVGKSAGRRGEGE